MPPPKSSTTCVQCRTRKVRCSGEAYGCSNCQRLEFSCSFAESLACSGSGSSPQLERKRRPLACVPCRATKSRCTGERPVCEPCRARERDCRYPDAKRRTQSNAERLHRAGEPWSSKTHGPAARSGFPTTSSHLAQQEDTADDSSPGTAPIPQIAMHGMSSAGAESDAQSYSAESVGAVQSGSLVALERSSAATMTGSWKSSISNPSPEVNPRHNAMPTVRERLQILNDFFRHLYPLPGCAFLSEVSITKRCLEGSIDEALLLAICAYTASTVKYPKYHPHQTLKWVQAAEDVAWHNIEHPTVFRTQALLLSVLCRVEMGNFKKGYMLLSMTSRFASALRLQYERLDLDHLSQEIRRRLTWSIMLADSQFSVGLPESGVCQSDLIYLKMPCPEEDFHADDLGLTSPSLDGVSEGGMLHRYVRLSIFRRDVMRLKRHLSVQSNPTPQITPLVEEMLKSIKDAEPKPYSREDLQSFANSRWLLRYVAVQVAWHQAHCDLYRLFVSGYREAAPDYILQECASEYVEEAAILCLWHAKTVIGIIRDVGKLGHNIVTAPRDLCIGGYHASRLLLFLSGHSRIPAERNIKTEEAMSAAKEILDILRPLFSSHVVLSKTVQDLEHIITMHETGALGQPKDSSDEEQTNDGDKRRPRFAMAIQKHTSLGVHSALRYARFRDDDDEGPPRSAEQTSTRVAGSVQEHSDSTGVTRQRPRPNLQGAAPLHDSGLPAATNHWTSLNLAEQEQLNWFTSMGIMDPAMQVAWDQDLVPAWAWQNDFSPGSSHECI